MKLKSVWYCTSCGSKFIKWAGQCSGCQAWNTLQEEVEAASKPAKDFGITRAPQKPIRLSEVSERPIARHKTHMAEFDRLVGGGIVPGSLTLLGGEPGIGKSTLSLQLAHTFTKQGATVLYISGEESLEQTSMRAKRLDINGDLLYLLAETEVSAIIRHVEVIKPVVLIVDSIQIVYKAELPAAPGSVSQVREAATTFMQLAKTLDIATILIGHVTKSGEIAGPKVLEHLVDTVLYFEGDRQHGYRFLRANKNRFGPTEEVALFQMGAAGLSEVANPSLVFLEERLKEVSGSAINPTIEGTRAILVEVQALVASSSFPTSTRKSTGIDQNRL